ncbi:hypothetical protein JTB14_015595 [Gonioctena quinquepunctata]|nr:hypothetical protein JTB14_015595 [Gonioctena quinquepunctata]
MVQYLNKNAYIAFNLNLNVSIKNPKEIDEAVLHFTNTIQQAAWYSTPLQSNAEPVLFPCYMEIRPHYNDSKNGKPPQETSSYRPISLLPPIPSKILERLLLKRIQDEYDLANILPNYQFGFRENMFPTHQAHRIVNTRGKTLERKENCNGVFLHVSQVFDKVWHTSLLYKVKKYSQ